MGVRTIKINIQSKTIEVNEKMSDTKSRYEIVQELTDQKQKLIDETNQINDRVLERECTLIQLGVNHKREVETNERNHTEVLQDTKMQLEAFKKSSEERKRLITLKEAALTESIEAIKAISANNEKA